MGSQVNRNLQAKYEKARGQKVEAAQIEYSKPVYNQPKPVVSYDGAMVERVAMIRTDRRLKAIVNGIEVVAWKRGEKALTMRQHLRSHF